MLLFLHLTYIVHGVQSKCPPPLLKQKHMKLQALVITAKISKFG